MVSEPDLQDLYLPSSPSLEVPANGPDLPDLVESIRREHSLPALGGLRLRHDRVDSALRGFRRNGASQEVRDGDKMHLGSCAKAMTATLVARLVEERALAWRSSLAEIFGELAGEMHPAFRQVTLEMLTSHISGLPRNFSPELMRRMYREPIERRELMRLLTREAPATPPGEDFVYSNAGYVVVGAVIERVTGRPWETMLRDLVYTPLQMCGAGFGPAGLEHPWGHTEEGRPVPPDWDVWREDPEHNPPPDNPPQMGPSGGVHASLGDWCRFALAHLERRAGFLSPESWDFLQMPQPGRDYTPGGWGVGENGELVHTGSNTLYFCLVRLRPAQSTVVLTAANQAGDNGPAACLKLGRELMASP
jgi:CubicO group peptidase (beta-lactamase class C family)